MPTDDLKKRKACQSCTRAKAKCSVLVNRPDLCYRCQRLKKECVFEDSIRKRGPKTRSRVKQLEQRVDTLIDLLAPNGQPAETNERTQSVPIPPTTMVDESGPNATSGTLEATRCMTAYITPAETLDGQSTCDSSEGYDPVEAGIIDERTASALLQEFKESCVSSFPFVIVPATTDAVSLRKDSPFLFLSLMAVMNYRTPAVQEILAREFKGQIASRIIGNSQKSLEILQGLLVYGAWYHFFYRSEKQQLAIVIQLCVAMVQDLGLSKNPKERARKVTFSDDLSQMSFVNTDRSRAGQRAFLGTYHLTVAFAQAWRKRGTMQHSRYITQCCRSISDHQEYPSDVLISPMIQSSELLSRVNEFFSYDDVENADVQGDMIIEQSTANFRSELTRIRSALPANLSGNTTLSLELCLIDIWIHECSLHESLWSPSLRRDAPPISTSRLKTLYRCLSAMKAYVNVVLAVPQASLHHLSFPPWSGWFYATIVACKLVFLEDNEREAQTDLEPTYREVSNLLSNDFLKVTPSETYALPAGREASYTTSWDPVAVAKEAEVDSLFDRFIKKMEFTVPADRETWTAGRKDQICDSLFPLTCLQRSLTQSFTKRMKEHLCKGTDLRGNESASVQSSSKPNQNVTETAQARPGTSHFLFPMQPFPAQLAPQAHFYRQQMQEHPIPVMSNTLQAMNSIDFDSIAPPEQQPQLAYDDWLWNAIMDDFTIPPLWSSPNTH